MRLYHSISTHAAAAALVSALALPAAAQSRGGTPASAASGPSSFTIYVRSTPVGNEEIAVARTAEGWTIASSGRLNAPLDIVSRRLEMRYDREWKPLELTLDATVRGEGQTVHATVNGSTVTTDITIQGQSTITIAIPGAEIFLPNPFFAPYEALAARLRTLGAGTTMRAAGLQVSIAIEVGSSTTERIQTATELIETKRTHLKLTPEGGMTIEADLWADQAGRLLRLSIPVQELDVVREDIASAASRQVTVWRPNDESVKIPSLGFSLAGTLSRPAGPTAGRLPAVVLVGGSGPIDRDGAVVGVPIPVVGELASLLADAGFITLRYDKRGVGQSGGRLESADLDDSTDDLRSAVKLLADRKDVDPKRISVIGHREGGAVAMLAAAKDKRIAAVGLVATAGGTGADLVLEQQQHFLSRSSFSDAERQAKIDLQKRINQAVVTDKGWDELPLEARRPIDPEFQSVLAHDPAKVVPKVPQPILIVQGELDTQVAPANADRLEALARARKNKAAVQAIRVPGVNHLLVPATTGEIEEYGALRDRHVSPAVVSAIVSWLRTTLAIQ